MNKLLSNGKSDTPLLALPLSARRAIARSLPPWWVFLLTGIAWMLVSLIVLRFDYTSVFSISLLFGFVALAAGIAEIAMVVIARGWWKLPNALLAAVFIACAVVSFVHPGNTFIALAAAFSFLLVFAGAFDVFDSIAAHREIDAWWVQLIGGLIELALGFWAAGYWGRSAILLVGWVAAFALIRGVRDIVLAFRVRELDHGVDEDAKSRWPSRLQASGTHAATT